MYWRKLEREFERDIWIKIGMQVNSFFQTIMSAVKIPIKCRESGCNRQAGTVEVLDGGRIKLRWKNARHDGKIHEQEFFLEEILNKIKEAG